MKSSSVKKQVTRSEAGSTHKIAFDSVIETGRDWLDWINGSLRFEGIIKTRVPWDQLDDGEKSFINVRLKNAAPNLQLMLNSLYITMVAGFEEFLRASIRLLVVRLSGKRYGYNEIAESVVYLNVRESAKLLRRMDSPPDYISFNVADLCRGIGTCVPESKNIELNQYAMSDIDGLVRLESFFERVQVFEISLGWDSLGKEQSLKDALNMSSGGAREVGKELSAELQKISRNRNRIAHTGGEASDVTSQLLSDHRVLLLSLSNVIDSALEGK